MGSLRARTGNEGRPGHFFPEENRDDTALIVKQFLSAGGVDNYLQVIIAQTTDLANERKEADILRRRMDASVLLIKALGGGWNISQLPSAAQVSQNGKDQIVQNPLKED
jgi:hypothetical protein